MLYEIVWDHGSFWPHAYNCNTAVLQHNTTISSYDIKYNCPTNSIYYLGMKENKGQERKLATLTKTPLYTSMTM